MAVQSYAFGLSCGENSPWITGKWMAITVYMYVYFYYYYYVFNVCIACYYAVNDGINADTVDLATSINQLHGYAHEACVRTSAGIIAWMYSVGQDLVELQGFFLLYCVVDGVVLWHIYQQLGGFAWHSCNIWRNTQRVVAVSGLVSRLYEYLLLLWCSSTMRLVKCVSGSTANHSYLETTRDALTWVSRTVRRFSANYRQAELLATLCTSVYFTVLGSTLRTTYMCVDCRLLKG